jgi:hypothetical protein
MKQFQWFAGRKFISHINRGSARESRLMILGARTPHC